MHTRPAARNPFTDPGIATRYEPWYRGKGRRADRLEKKLLRHLLGNFPAPASLLEVGCGTGHFTRWFQEQGLGATGLDLSLAMLCEARAAARLPWILGDGQALPFRDQSFDLVALITTLEFVAEPSRVLAECLRVTRRGLLLGVINRHSLLGRRLLARGGPVWTAARPFSVIEIEQLVRASAELRSLEIVWRTTLWPLWPTAIPLPWGGFIGMASKIP